MVLDFILLTLIYSHTRCVYIDIYTYIFGVMFVSPPRSTFDPRVTCDPPWLTFHPPLWPLLCGAGVPEAVVVLVEHRPQQHVDPVQLLRIAPQQHPLQVAPHPCTTTQYTPGSHHQVTPPGYTTRLHHHSCVSERQSETYWRRRGTWGRCW